MPVLIPERTIDSLFAFEFLSVAPTAVIWSPHNNRGSGTVDHEIRTARRYFEVECKTIYRDDPGSRWYVKVPMPQLRAYLAAGKQKLIYLLPSRPADDDVPWDRQCGTDPDPLGQCLACAHTLPSEGAVFYRRQSFRDPHVYRAAPEVRLQPWFNHWAWCISARNLAAFLGAFPALVKGDVAHIPADDAFMSWIPGTERMCHLFDAVYRDFVTVEPFGPRGRVSGRDGDDLDGGFELEDWTMPRLAEEASATFVPLLDEGADERRVLAWY